MKKLCTHTHVHRTLQLLYKSTYTSSPWEIPSPTLATFSCSHLMLLFHQIKPTLSPRVALRKVAICDTHTHTHTSIHTHTHTHTSVIISVSCGRTSSLQSVSVSPARAPDRLGLMTWPDSSKQPSDAMINESDLLISGEYSLLYQKHSHRPKHRAGLVNILLYFEKKLF